MLDTVREAFYTARQERLPVVLGVPMDLQKAPFPWGAEYSPSTELMPTPQRPAPDPALVEKLAAMIMEAQRPIILAGRGVLRSGAGPSLEALAERCGALLATSLFAKGLFDHNRFGIGVAGAYASPLAREEFAWARHGFERASALDPDHEDAIAGLGEVLLKFGQREAALQAFDRILELGFKDDHELMLQVGRALFREGLLGPAHRFFEYAVQAQPESADASACVGYAAHRLGRESNALYWLRRALEVDPDFSEARIYLANLLYDRGESEAALRHLERTEPDDHFDELGLWRYVELRKAAYRLPDDDEDVESQFEITINDHGGFPINAVGWGHRPDLIDKLRIVKAPGQLPAKLDMNPRGVEPPDWDSTLPDHSRRRMKLEEPRTSHCTWVHDVNCNWWDDCPDD